MQDNAFLVVTSPTTAQMDELQLQHDLLENEEYYREELLHRVAVLGALIIAGADEA
jgi:hypothetical protein